MWRSLAYLCTCCALLVLLGALLPAALAATTPAESSEHGRGLILMRALADRMRLRCGPAGTALTLRFSPAPLAG